MTSEIPRVPLAVAARDPGYLGSTPLWPRQLELLGHFEEGPRVHVVDWGRRGSKTTCAAVTAVWMSLLLPELRTFLRPRERGWAVCVATNQKQARIFVDAARSLVHDSPLLAGFVESQSQEEILFTNGMGIAAFPCTSRSGRGWPIFCLVLDEFAQHLDADHRSQAEEVWGSLTPSTAQFGDLSRILVLSTPQGAQGLFYELFRRAESGELPGAMAHRARTVDVNPTITQEFLDMERVALGPDVFAAEYEGEFTAGGGRLFEREQLERCCYDGAVSPDDGSGWVAALDPSSGGGDPFALALVGRDRRKGFEGRLLVAVLERWVSRRVRPARRGITERELWVDWVLDEVAEHVRRFGAAVISDQHVPGVVQERLLRRGVRQVGVRPWTGGSRLRAFQAVAARVGTETISWPREEQLVGELARVVTRFRGGSASIHIPQAGDSHGDLAVALASGVAELDSEGLAPRRASISRPSVLDAVAGARLGSAR